MSSAAVTNNIMELPFASILIAVGIIVAVGLLIFTAMNRAKKAAKGYKQASAVSEFAKITLILVAANLLTEYYEGTTRSSRELQLMFIFGVLAPLGLIFVQPDKGTVTVVAVTLIIMLYFGGASGKMCVGLLVLGIAVLAFVSYAQPYSRARIQTMINPWSDPYNKGYQLIQGFYAFGSGGLFGVGLGFSRQKYSYLPMAHNDFIFAVIGEELGLVGTLGMLAVFALLGWAGARIAKNAPDLAGRLIASGCTGLIIIQLLVNVCGVLGMIPLTGKPVPFISYGGSTIVTCMLLSGLTVSVSRASRLPETVYDQARGRWNVDEREQGDGRAFDAVEGFGGTHGEETFVSDPTPRSARTQTAFDAHSTDLAQSPFRVVEGGAGRSRGASDSQPSGRSRIDLGPSATERLRGGSKERGKKRR